MRFTRGQLARKCFFNGTALGLSAVTALMATVFGAWFALTGWRDARLAFGGVVVPGTVTNKWMTGAGKSAQWWVGYSFVVNETPHVGQIGMRFRDSEAVAPGDSVTVVVLPGDPGVSRFGPPVWQRPAGFPLGLGLVFALTAVGFLAGGLWLALREATLVTAGTPTLGIIDAVETETPTRGKNAGQPYVTRIIYRYGVPGGGLAAVRTVTRKYPLWVEPNQFAVGDTVLVLFDPANPARHVIDRFDVRAEDRERLLDERPAVEE